MRKQISQMLLPISLVVSCASFAADKQPNLCSDNAVFNVGAGIYDITGPAAEEGMLGYAMMHQQTAGIAQRLWARAFVIESPCNQKRVVLVNTDLCMVTEAVKQEVVRKLKEKYGDRYDDKNVLLTATHTHSGPGGFSTYFLYNLTTLGFDKKHFDTIVDGVVNAIERAQSNMTKAQMKIAEGDLNGISFNRSPMSYLENPIAERNRYQADRDTKMTLLRFDSIDGKPMGTVNWFPLHGVSMNNKNHLISSDNKGYAEYLFEKDFQSDNGPHAFVAAFLQANAGDVSPNEFGHEGGTGLDGVNAIEKAGRPQYEKAKSLYNTANEVVKGGVDYRHTFLAMDKINIEPQYTDGKLQTTCPAAIGVSMLAGTQDGEGVGWQGVSCDVLKERSTGFTCQITSTPCQGVKPIALPTGSMKPHPWTPPILPLQVVTVGNVVIVAAPFELTTMTGRRIREAVNAQLPKEGHYHIVISALSNAYAGYVATNEEYQLQRYEGASTQFGPWQQAALSQAFAKLTKALVKGEPVENGPQPPDLHSHQQNMQPGVLFDDKPLGKQFGDVHQEVKKAYHPGDTAEAQFWGAHPKNNYHTQDTFLAVEQRVNGEWVIVRRDNDADTEYHWQRNGVSYSLITLLWRIPHDMPKGQYRFRYNGDAKSAITTKMTAFTGYSSVFEVI